VYGEIVRKLALGEEVRIFVPDTVRMRAAQRVLKKVGVDLSGIRFFRLSTDRGWTRDSGPMFVRNRLDRAVNVMGFRFNAWARYPNWKKDAKTPARVARELDLTLVIPKHKGKEIVLEGGAIDTNGCGTLLTTEECMLDPNRQVRNPGLTRLDMEEIFKEWLVISNTIWLGKGIAGDDTHGHVDDLCRFVNPTTVVLCTEHNERDENYGSLRENKERLSDARLENGGRLEVIDLPMPRPLIFDGVRLPASYANFYIANAAVLVPTFNDPADRIALGVLSELFPTRMVVGIHAVDLVWGFGTLHCLTHEQPAAEERRQAGE
jgi:agmatine deiminase